MLVTHDDVCSVIMDEGPNYIHSSQSLMGCGKPCSGMECLATEGLSKTVVLCVYVMGDLFFFST